MPMIVGVTSEQDISASRFLQYLLFSILQLPLFAGVIPGIPRELLNVASLGAAGLLAILLFGTYRVGWNKLLISSVFFLFLTLQFAHVTWLSSSSLGVMTALRYMFYFLILYGFARQAILSIDLDLLANSLAFGVFLSGILGLIGDRFIFLNGVERFQGASHSPAALSLHAAVALVAVLAASSVPDSVYRRHPVYSFAAIVVPAATLAATGSRQPALGLLLVGTIWLVRKYPLVAVAASGVAIAAMLTPNRLFDTDLNYLRRPIELAYAVGSAITSFSLESLDEASFLARIRYMAVGYDYVIRDLNLFGGGFNSFPYVFQSATGQPNVAPHNDLLMVLMDWGFLGLFLVIGFLLWNVILVAAKKDVLSPYIVLFWFIGLSLNNPTYYYSIFIPLCVLYRKLYHLDRMNYDSLSVSVPEAHPPSYFRKRPPSKR